MRWWLIICGILGIFVPVLAQNHLLISEIQVSPDTMEYIEVFNPNPVPLSLDNYYLTDYNTYYQLVENAFPSATGDFLVQFPAGTSIDSAGVLVIAVDGSVFSGQADFELKSNSTVPDMISLYLGSSVSLSNQEMVMLFYWDGQSDLVSDIDYTTWGSTTSTFVDKSSISIDGPDPDTTPSTYLNDTPVTSQQYFPTAPITGQSMSRLSVSEAGEILLNGNGIQGHNETSEPIAANFQLLQAPTPGTTELIVPSGNGSGLAYIRPDSVRIDSTLDLQVIVKGTIQEVLVQLSVTIPASWNWSGLSGDVSLSGPGLSGAGISINAREITINLAQISPQDSGIIEIRNLTSPSQAEESTFEVKTAIAGGVVTAISASPKIMVWRAVSIIPIAEIQANPSAFTSVTIEGIVVLGAGITTTGWTDAYVQDASGAGINIYQSGIVDPDLQRGNKIRISGTVDEYSGVTEIIDYTAQVISTANPLPDPVILTTQQANNINLEGSWVEVSGGVTDFAQNVGGGANIRINDGSGECLIRVWNSTMVNLSGVSIGQQLLVRGPLDIYSGATQLLLAYQADLTIVQANPGDGSGSVTVTPDSVGVNQGNLELVFDFIGEAPYTLEAVSIAIPADWQWSGSATEVQLEESGFTAAQVTTTTSAISISQAAVSSSNPGRLRVQNLTSPNSDTYSTFVIKTAISGGVLTSISAQPRVKVGEGIETIPISQIQLNSQYVGQQVTIMGVVVLGAGITATGWTDAYVQDNSGYGINIYQGGSVDSRLVRRNLVMITGTVDEFNGVTEIVDYQLEVLSENNSLPIPTLLTTSEAADVRWEGVWIEISGLISSITSAGGGTNIMVDDGSGEVTLRIWDTAGLNVNIFAAGDTVTARGVVDIYSGDGQILIGYQEDIFKPGGSLAGDGSGFAVIDPDTVAIGQSGVSVKISLWSSPEDTLRTVHLLLPNNWSWSGLEDEVEISGRGFTAAEKQVILEYGEYWLEISNCQVTALDTGTITIQQFTAPYESVYSYFWVKTAVEGGIPQFIGQSPRVRVGSNPIYLIRDLQLNSAQFREPVVIQGVVTVGAGILRTDRTSAYMQDESGYGINVNQSGAPDLRIQRGFYLELEGTVSEYRQTTQITPAGIAILDSASQLPEPFSVSTGEAFDPRWDGTLIQVPRSIGQEYAVVIDKYTTSTQAPYDYNLVVNDGSGALTLRVWGTTGINLDSVEINKAIIASGVGSVFIQNNIPLYQILPAYQEDIILDPSYQPTLEGVALDVPPNPFVPDRGEMIQIRYNAGAVNNQITIRIFDLGGRLVTVLLDEQAQLLVNTLEWNGRNQYFDFVPLGTYLCHLEVLEPVSGKKRVKTAPIVVGTILKK